jgi:hypothetical protein
MQFRWAAGIALWTFISGPVFGPPTANPQSSRKPGTVASTKKWRADSAHANARPQAEPAVRQLVRAR